MIARNAKKSGVQTDTGPFFKPFCFNPTHPLKWGCNCKAFTKEMPHGLIQAHDSAALTPIGASGKTAGPDAPRPYHGP